VEIILRMFLGDSFKNGKSSGINQFIYYIFNIVICSLAIILVRLDVVTRKDYLLLAVVTLVLILTIVQIELTTNLTSDIEHNITIAVLISVAFINRTIHSRFIIILTWAVSLWCLSLNLRLLRLNGRIHTLILAESD